MSRPSESISRKPRNKSSINPASFQSPMKQTSGSTVTIPLNDDAAEKARRLQNRHALQDLQMNKIVAAATPRKQVDITQATPGTRGGRQTNGNGGDDGTPVKKVPILANFEEWMKMATDNVRFLFVYRISCQHFCNSMWNSELMTETLRLLENQCGK